MSTDVAGDHGKPNWSDRELPPMLRQYREFKRSYPDLLILFQVGDFYEAFFEDALILARTLNITLTSREKQAPDPIPMAGVPVAVLDGYLERLLAAGLSAAVVSQKEGTNGKGMVARELERIVTPGVPLAAGVGSTGEAGLVAAVAAAGQTPAGLFGSGFEYAVAFSDVQSGKVYLREGLPLRALIAELQRVSPTEVIVPRQIEGRTVDRRSGWVRQIETVARGAALKFRTLIAGAAPGSGGTGRALNGLPGYSTAGVGGKAAVRLLLSFIDEVTVQALLPIRSIVPVSDRDVLVLDATTRANLELVKNIRDGSPVGSLYGVMDRTETSAGSKLLRQWVLNPLRDVTAILERQQAIAICKRHGRQRSLFKENLRLMADGERIAARIELGLVMPSELGALRVTLSLLPELRTRLEELSDVGLDGLLDQVHKLLFAPSELLELLDKSLVDAPPPSLKDGGVMREGYDPELDRLRSVRREGKSWLTALENRERESTGIGSLRVKFNNVHGYFLEVTKANLAKVPERYVRKQTTVNAERFITPELKDIEQEVLGAQDRQLALELELFSKLRQQLEPFTAAVRQVSEGLALLDVIVALAEYADQLGLVAPKIDRSSQLSIVRGRHPVLEQLLQQNFVANSVSFQEQGNRCLIITGANMGGKSTYLRQVGLLTIMAQMGSFIPAEEASIGVVDRIFARIGAADDQLEGDSTFMVEMREAANIVSQASDRSLLLIDEIGRGTATADGRALARAILEWVVERIGCRTLFATHFNELTKLAQELQGVQNLSVGSIDRDGQVIFTHEICQGPANRSYGIEVAVLAGLPKELVQRARDLLELDAVPPPQALEVAASNQLLMFVDGQPAREAVREVVRPPADYKALQDLANKIGRLNADQMTPLEALNCLAALRNQWLEQGLDK